MLIRRLICPAVLCVVLSAPNSPTAAQSNALDGPLDRYARGDFNSAIDEAVGDGSIARLNALTRNLERQTRPWISAHRGSEDRARLIVATFAMDVAAVFLDRAPAIKERDRTALDRDL